MESDDLISRCVSNLSKPISKLQGNVEIVPVSICHIVTLSSVDESSSSDQNEKEKISGEEPLSTTHSNTQPRIRKKKRPYSPELITSCSSKNHGRPKFKKEELCLKSKVEVEEPTTFSCDHCQSSCIVNPARCHLAPTQLKKKPSRRKKLDPATNRIINLCNACGIALARPPKREKKIISSAEDREKYLEEAASFANAIAERVQNPAAKRLFCPSFKNKPCGCIQTYLTHEGGTEQNTLESRVETLLELLKTANHLGRRKNIFPSDNISDIRKNCENTINASERRQQLQEFEQFVLETRQLLRDKLRLCERACQRLLLYSNNFLHKKLKSEQGSRISRQPGRAIVNQLKSIDELCSVSCCSDNCSRIARTHSALLEEWRKQAAQGQRQARRVLAEMLTPSGGTKANCYKFISMVTGCGNSTISSVSHQMRVTKGDREPPEHGLKKWYRDNPRKKVAQPKQKNKSVSPTKIPSALPPPMSIRISNPAEPDAVPEQNSGLELQEQQQQIADAKQQVLLEHQELDHCQKTIDQRVQQSLNFCNPNSDKTWKMDVSKSKDKQFSGITSVSIHEESNLAIFPNGESIQLLDLIPGTYLAVPTDFHTSSFLTVSTPNIKFNTPSDVTVHEDLSDAHATVSSELFHAVPSSRSVAMTSDLGVQTILNIPSAADDMNTILTDADSSSQLDIHYVTIPSETCSPMDDNSSASAAELLPLTSLQRSHCSMAVDSPSSNSVSVITTTGQVQSNICKTGDQLSSVLASTSQGQCMLDTEGHSTNEQDAKCVSPPLSNILLLPKPSDTHERHPLDTFSKFF